MEDVITELRIVNQRLSNLEFQVKDLDKRFESFRGKFQENKVKFSGHLNSQFEGDSFTNSSFDVQQINNQPANVALSNFNSGKSSGKYKL